MIIKGKDLIKLGFKKRVEKPTRDPEDYGYHYFVYELNGKCLLISNTNDERIGGGYTVEFYEISEISYRKLRDLKKLMKLIEKGHNG